MLSVDFIYSEYASTLGHVGNDYRKMVWQIAEDYACATVLLRLPGYSPMPAFGEVIDVPLVVRHAQKSKAQVSQPQSSLDYPVLPILACSVCLRMTVLEQTPAQCSTTSRATASSK